MKRTIFIPYYKNNLTFCFLFLVCATAHNPHEGVLRDKYEGWSIKLFRLTIGSLFVGGFTSFSVIINSNLSLIRRKHENAKYVKRDVTMTLMTSHVGDFVVKTLEDSSVVLHVLH